MARPNQDESSVQWLDFIPEGQEYLRPAQGCVFRDFIPEGKMATDYDETGAEIPAKPPVSEEVAEPDPTPNKSGTKSNKA